MATITERGGIAVDTRELHDFAKYLRKATKDANRNFRKGLREAGELIAEEARKRADEHSTTISPTIKVRVSGASVTIQAGNDKVPIAALLELGNHGGGKKSAAAASRGEFRHPVFGNRDAWVKQPMHPYLLAAGEAKTDAAMTIVTRTINDALDAVQIEVT